MSKKRKKSNKLKYSLKKDIAKFSPRDFKGKSVSISEFTITFEPLYESNIPDVIRKQLEELYYLVQDKPEEAIPRLQKLINDYPDIPALYNNHYAAYFNSGDMDKASKILYETHEKFPDYLFAKVNLAEIFINSGKLDKVPEIFGNQFELKRLYPDREIFHVSEVIGFYGVMGVYWVKMGNIISAKVCYDLLNSVNPDHSHTQRLLSELNHASLVLLLKKKLNK